MAFFLHPFVCFQRSRNHHVYLLHESCPKFRHAVISAIEAGVRTINFLLHFLQGLYWRLPVNDALPKKKSRVRATT